MGKYGIYATEAAASKAAWISSWSFEWWADAIVRKTMMWLWIEQCMQAMPSRHEHTAPTCNSMWLGVSLSSGFPHLVSDEIIKELAISR
mmetsp:Transcript_23769/g.39278  ORF Transcript_23769/g.39278 Transcript_23769/m.39278 type:complete len:89 (-) Transcript_23769:191-457(-)